MQIFLAVGTKLQAILSNMALEIKTSHAVIHGTKLEAILSNMDLEITENHAVIQGTPLFQGSDKYFWFGKPELVLHRIHFALFQVFQFVKFILKEHKTQLTLIY